MTVPAPRLSVVLVTDTWATIRAVIERFSRQTIVADIEMVVVAPSREALMPDEAAFTPFADVRIIEAGAIHPMCFARALGVRAAAAPVIFLGETHSYPQAGFAEAILDAHAGPWDVVVPGLGNANPKGALSWAAFLLDYGYWLHTMSAGTAAFAPTWNVAYKRAALLDLGDDLGPALSAGDTLGRAFRQQRRTLRFHPAARLDHANVARGLSWIDERFLTGLMVGGGRRAGWPLRKCVAHALASPLIFVVVFARVWRPWRVAASNGMTPPGTMVALLAGTLVRTVGEAWGYLAGIRANTEQRMEGYELHKVKYAAVSG